MRLVGLVTHTRLRDTYRHISCTNTNLIIWPTRRKNRLSALRPKTACELWYRWFWTIRIEADNEGTQYQPFRCDDCSLCANVPRCYTSYVRLVMSCLAPMKELTSYSSNRTLQLTVLEKLVPHKTKQRNAIPGSRSHQVNSRGYRTFSSFSSTPLFSC
jgi:hypothetical protein